MNASERWIAIARISGSADRKGFWPITVGGDGLTELTCPFKAALYKSDYTGQDLKRILGTATRGPRADGEYFPVQVLAAQVHGKKGRIQLPAEPIRQILKQNGALQGYWLCVNSSQLAASSEEYYVFELLGLPVYRSLEGEEAGRIIHYLDNGAHGVIEIELNDKKPKQLIMVPVVRKYVDFTKKRDGLIIKDLDEFIVTD